ncbi:MAG TPA: hypothetical protein VMD59_24180 [Acidimicrobiales bacterium]|nr:hypothetical protein [Acidimicrobiales bacterium]
MSDDEQEPVSTQSALAELARLSRNGGAGRPVEAVSMVVEHAAALVDELNQQLGKVNEWAARERAVELSEQQIGRLLAEAEATAERTIADARQLARELVTTASEEASRIRAGVGLPPVQFQTSPIFLEAVIGAPGASPIDEVRALRQALIEFSRTNSALLSGLADLVDELARRALPESHDDEAGASERTRT